MSKSTLRKISHWLGGAAILVAGSWLGNLTSSSLSLPIPGSVVGMLVLLLILVLYGGVPTGLSRVSSQLLYLLPLLLLPAAVGVFFFQGLTLSDWLALIAAIFIGTLVSIAICALLLKKMLIGSGGGEDE
ncbi:CidA/LrgA family protein [Microbulbifer sp. A4B17]|uniref:CidA/LrgA family protein n=1 Tax=Microbulbifer sp. A4B17 TaxID=359370 RepID=UPI00130066FA|nr:CidA/LrgA family protein [Microbulbifer sp. A4B17]